MPKASLLFAAVIFLAAGNLSPAFASKCYGLDPCEACRNCHACKHCHELGGKCGVCKRDRNAKLGRNSKVAAASTGQKGSRLSNRRGARS